MIEQKQKGIIYLLFYNIFILYFLNKIIITLDNLKTEK